MVRFPEYAELYLTNRCNLRCRYCYVEHDNYDNELSGEQWGSIISDYYYPGC